MSKKASAERRAVDLSAKGGTPRKNRIMQPTQVLQSRKGHSPGKPCRGEREKDVFY